MTRDFFLSLWVAISLDETTTTTSTEHRPRGVPWHYLAGEMSKRE